MISIYIIILFVVEMWNGREDGEEDVADFGAENLEQRRVDRRREYAKFRRWLDEEEVGFYDMLVEFDGVEDSTEDDWVGWLSFREEFEGVLYFFIEEAEDLEDWDAEMVGRYFYGA